MALKNMYGDVVTDTLIYNNELRNDTSHLVEVYGQENNEGAGNDNRELAISRVLERLTKSNMEICAEFWY